MCGRMWTKPSYILSVCKIIFFFSWKNYWFHLKTPTYITNLRHLFFLYCGCCSLKCWYVTVEWHWPCVNSVGPSACVISNGFLHTERRTAASVSLLCINKRAPSAFICTICGGAAGAGTCSELHSARSRTGFIAGTADNALYRGSALVRLPLCSNVSIISGVTCSAGWEAALTTASSLHKPGSNWLHVREPLRDLWPSLQLEHGELEQKQKNPNGLYITINNPSDSRRRNHDRRWAKGGGKNTRQINEEVEMIDWEMSQVRPPLLLNCRKLLQCDQQQLCSVIQPDNKQ